jgi:sugar O-acyltransferase (sialic acid O-acetyltransferase NeuD family)
MYRLLIVGAGGFGREVLLYAKEIQKRDGNFDVGGFLDRDKAALSGFDIDTPIVGDELSWPVAENDRFVIATGNPELRGRLYGALVGRGAKFMNIIHPLAWIAPNATLGDGIIAAPFATINANAKLEDNVAINSHVGIGHDTRIGRHSAISPFTVVAGAAVVGEKVFIGSSCVVAPRKEVGRRATIAAGSVVHKNVPDNAFATGNPAAIHRNWRASDK